MKTVETRQLAAPCEIRRKAQSAYIEGRIPYNSRSEDLGGFVEVIAPGAFKRTLNARGDVKAFWAHDEKEILGSTAAGTMTLEDRADELHFSIRVPAGSANRIESIERGDVQGVSFGFITDPKGEEWDILGPEAIRTLKSVHLLEISPGVAFPAYPAAHAGAAHRSAPTEDGTLAAMRAEVDFYSEG
ncbi:MAG: HK97 family phage prohead protease [Clostridia bacterium]